MAFDPNLPADDTLATAGAMRDQLNGLNDLITPKVSMQDVLDAIAAGAARSLDNVAPINMPLHDPVTRAEGQAIIDKINEMLGTAHS